MKSNRQQKKRRLNERRRAVRDLIVPLCDRSKDGLAIPVDEYAREVCSKRGLKTLKTTSNGYHFRDWSKLTISQIRNIERHTWRPSKPKAPLDYLAECAE